MANESDSTETLSDNANASAWSRLAEATQRAGLLRSLKGIVASALTGDPEKMAKAFGVSRDELETLMNDLKLERPDIVPSDKTP